MSNTIPALARRVHAEEAATMRARGWVRLPGLVTSELAATCLDQARDLVDRLGDGTRQAVVRPSSAGEPFASLVRSAELGAGAAQLLGRDSSIRLLGDTLDVDNPGRGSDVTFHQDAFGRPFDRNRVVYTIALNDISADQGGECFYDASQTLGPLGIGELSPEQIARWPRLAQLPISTVGELGAGDAVAYITGVVHARMPNHGHGPRYTLSVVYIPADSRYLGFPHPHTDGLGLKPLEPVDHPALPIVYSGTAPPLGAGDFDRTKATANVGG